MNFRVQKFTSAGDFIKMWGSEGVGEGEFRGAFGIATDQENNVFVVDAYNSRIQKFSPDGEFISMWGSKGAGDGQLNLPLSIDIDNNGNIYVVDSLNYRIHKFTSNGEFTAKWGAVGAGDGEFAIPWGIATDHMGFLYASDAFLGRIQKFTQLGEFVTKWGRTGILNNQFTMPAEIATDSEGNVFVCDNGNHVVKKFTSEGDFVTHFGSEEIDDSFGFPFAPFAIAVDNDGYVYVSDRERNTIKKFVKSTSSTTTTICPSEIALHGNTDQVQKLRNLRDKVLATSSKGNDYIHLYYQHAPELASLFLSDGKLKSKAQKLLVAWAPTIQSILDDEEIVLPEELISAIDLFIKEISLKASIPLQDEISRIQSDIKEGKLFKKLGIKYSK